MMLPIRISIRLRTLLAATIIALVIPAFDGFKGSVETDDVQSNVFRRFPFSAAAWRKHLGFLEESVRSNTGGTPVKEEAAHPAQAPLVTADEGAPTSKVTPRSPDDWTNEPISPVSKDAIDVLGSDWNAFSQTVQAYKVGDFNAAETAAEMLQTNAHDTAARWTGIKLHPKEAGFKRLSSFLLLHPKWPSSDWLKKRTEEALFSEHHHDRIVKSWFEKNRPITGYGKFLMARAFARDGKFEAAMALARDAWRNDDVGQGFDTMFVKELGPLLSVDDHKYRADRLAYSGKNTLALRAAELAGKDVVLLIRVRAATNNGNSGEKIYSSVPASLQNDPGLLYSRVRGLNNAKKFIEAGELLRRAPQDPALLIDGDAWWAEQKQTARKLLDSGDSQTAYVIASRHSARSTSNRVEAEFMAGWIALRFLHDATLATQHFASLEAAAETPLQKSRALYWRGRAAEARRTKEDQEAAWEFYKKAAAHSTSFYGQLASAKLGLPEHPLRQPPPAASRTEFNETVRSIEALLASGEREVAAPLALDAAKNLEDEKQVVALGDIIAQHQDAKLSLVFGKSASYRGVALDHIAFPAYGIPDFSALPGSATRAVVYAVARQESAFDPKAVSSAGAMGLMQMIAPTARHTAFMRGVSFDISRMLKEPAFNAQLGAAHLGILLGEYRGAYILTFAAYNAGGGRVKQWIDAYGDPRKAMVDPIDWIERIPITETRNYVQRVMENFIVYRSKFGENSTRAPQQELARMSDMP